MPASLLACCGGRELDDDHIDALAEAVAEGVRLGARLAGRTAGSGGPLSQVFSHLAQVLSDQPANHRRHVVARVLISPRTKQAGEEDGGDGELNKRKKKKRDGASDGKDGDVQASVDPLIGGATLLGVGSLVSAKGAHELGKDVGRIMAPQGRSRAWVDNFAERYGDVAAGGTLGALGVGIPSYVLSHYYPKLRPWQRTLIGIAGAGIGGVGGGLLTDQIRGLWSKDAGEEDDVDGKPSKKKKDQVENEGQDGGSWWDTATTVSPYALAGLLAAKLVRPIAGTVGNVAATGLDYVNQQSGLSNDLAGRYGDIGVGGGIGGGVGGLGSYGLSRLFPGLTPAQRRYIGLAGAGLGAIGGGYLADQSHKQAAVEEEEGESTDGQSTDDVGSRYVIPATLGLGGAALSVPGISTLGGIIGAATAPPGQRGLGYAEGKARYGTIGTGGAIGAIGGGIGAYSLASMLPGLTPNQRLIAGLAGLGLGGAGGGYLANRWYGPPPESLR